MKNIGLNPSSSVQNHLPKQKKALAITTLNYFIINELLNKYSSLDKSCRIIAYCLRFSKSHRPHMATIFVSHRESTYTLQVMCKSAQSQAFSERSIFQYLTYVTLVERTGFQNVNNWRPIRLVLLKQQDLAPMQWLLSRVEEVHPGADNVVRAATIRTARGTFITV